MLLLKTFKSMLAYIHVLYTVPLLILYRSASINWTSSLRRQGCVTIKDGHFVVNKLTNLMRNLNNVYKTLTTCLSSKFVQERKLCDQRLGNCASGSKCDQRARKHTHTHTQTYIKIALPRSANALFYIGY